MVNLGIIGVGRFGKNILNTFKQLEREGKCKVVAICDINEEILEKYCSTYNLKGYKDYKEMLEKENIDGVAIATPDPFHREPAVYAANLKKHIFVEKPLDITIEGCIEMIEICRKNNVLLQVDFHKRFDPYHKEIRRNVFEGKIGRVEYGYAYMEDRIEVPVEWFKKWASETSPAWFLGIHFYDLLRWILGSNGKSVYAKGKKWKLKNMGIDTYDSITAIVEFENGAVITFDTSWILPENFESIVNQGLRIVGEEGIIECDSQDRGTRVCFKDNGMMTYNMGFISEDRDAYGNIYYKGYGIESIADFVYNLLYINNGGKIDDLKKKDSAFGEDGLEATKIAVKVHESLKTGKIEEI
ncbi:MAG TPA: Gfo/Idh/MocA family oxidoreductase [bacterium]|nr:Gfo/Idh/MocA family oxidoreductase [bacterium]